MLFLIRFETGAAGGRKSKACDEMENTMFFEQRSEEAQISMTSNHSFRAFGGDGQGSWLDVYICGWCEVIKTKEDGSDKKIRLNGRRHLLMNVERRKNVKNVKSATNSEHRIINVL